VPNRNLYLIRNAQYLDNAENLTEQGQRQAILTAQAMRHLTLYALDCSPYPQVVETAKIIAEPHNNIRVKQTSLLRQYDSLRDIKMRTSEIFFTEDGIDLQRTQLEIAYQTYFYPPNELEDTHEILICHANIIRDLICRAIGVNPVTWAHMMINHCGISVMTIDELGDAHLLEYNETRHLPDSLRTG